MDEDILLKIQNIGPKLRKLRLDKDVSQEEIEKHTGISRSLLSKYEGGVTEPGSSALYRLGKYFNVSVDWLLGFTDNPEPLTLDNLKNKEEVLRYIEFLKEWHKIYAANLAETTRQLYKMYSDKHICPVIVRPMQIQELFNKKEETLSKKSISKLHTFLNRALSDACKNEYIKANPMDKVNRPKGKKFKATIYNEELFSKLLEVVSGTFDEVCILLAGVCGLRRGEIFGLRPRDLDREENKISIVETMVRFNGDWIIKSPKNDSSQRTIKVPQFVMTVVWNYLTSLEVVSERICAEYRPNSYSQHFKKLLANNGLPHIRFHDLRHFNATLMLKYNIPDKIASGRLGHSQYRLPEKYISTYCRIWIKKLQILLKEFLSEGLKVKKRRHKKDRSLGFSFCV